MYASTKNSIILSYYIKFILSWDILSKIFQFMKFNKIRKNFLWLKYHHKGCHIIKVRGDRWSHILWSCAIKRDGLFGFWRLCNIKIAFLVQSQYTKVLRGFESLREAIFDILVLIWITLIIQKTDYELFHASLNKYCGGSKTI